MTSTTGRVLFQKPLRNRECADAFAAPPMRRIAVSFIEELRRTRNLRIIPASTELLAEGWKLYAARPDKSWSLTDCISFVVIQEEGVSQAFTSDHHFGQAGFQKLL